MRWKALHIMLKIILIILITPIVFFEYFIFLWSWSGDGEFTFFTMPIVFIALLILQIILKKKFKGNMIVAQLLKFSMLLVTPVISVLIVWLIAKIFGIVINYT